MPNTTPHVDGRAKRIYTIKCRVAREWPFTTIDTADSPEHALAVCCRQLQCGMEAIIVETDTGEQLYPARRQV